MFGIQYPVSSVPPCRRCSGYAMATVSAGEAVSAIVNTLTVASSMAMASTAATAMANTTENALHSPECNPLLFDLRVHVRTSLFALYIGGCIGPKVGSPFVIRHRTWHSYSHSYPIFNVQVNPCPYSCSALRVHAASLHSLP